MRAALQSWNSLVQQGASMEAMGANAEALKLYLSAAQIDDQYAELQFRIARSQWLLGDYEAANTHYTRARDLDVLRFRADSRINEIIRAVAASRPGVQLLDTQALFSKESHNGIAGSELLYDHVHLTPLGSYLVARSAFEQIVKDLPSDVRASARSMDPLPEADCERLLAFTSHDRARVAQEMVERLTRPPFTTQLNHSEQIQSLMLRAASSTESPEDTLHQYQWALTQAPNDLTLHYKFGFFLFDFNREAAAQELMRARPNDDFPVFLPDGTRIQ